MLSGAEPQLLVVPQAYTGVSNARGRTANSKLEQRYEHTRYQTPQSTVQSGTLSTLRSPTSLRPSYQHDTRYQSLSSHDNHLSILNNPPQPVCDLVSANNDRGVSNACGCRSPNGPRNTTCATNATVNRAIRHIFFRPTSSSPSSHLHTRVYPPSKSRLGSYPSLSSH